MQENLISPSKRITWRLKLGKSGWKSPLTMKGGGTRRKMAMIVNGELFEMKMALQLGRSVSQLRELATKYASCRIEGREIHEFASKLF